MSGTDTPAKRTKIAAKLRTDAENYDFVEFKEKHESVYYNLADLSWDKICLDVFRRRDKNGHWYTDLDGEDATLYGLAKKRDMDALVLFIRRRSDAEYEGYHFRKWCLMAGER